MFYERLNICINVSLRYFMCNILVFTDASVSSYAYIQR